MLTLLTLCHWLPTGGSPPPFREIEPLFDNSYLSYVKVYPVINFAFCSFVKPLTNLSVLQITLHLQGSRPRTKTDLEHPSLDLIILNFQSILARFCL